MEIMMKAFYMWTYRFCQRSVLESVEKAPFVRRIANGTRLRFNPAFRHDLQVGIRILCFRLLSVLIVGKTGVESNNRKLFIYVTR